MPDTHTSTDRLTTYEWEAATDIDRSDKDSDSKPTFEEVAREAYAIYLANGARDGRDLDDWLDAERLLKTRSAK